MGRWRELYRLQIRQRRCGASQLWTSHWSSSRGLKRVGEASEKRWDEKWAERSRFCCDDKSHKSWNVSFPFSSVFFCGLRAKFMINFFPRSLLLFFSIDSWGRFLSIHIIAAERKFGFFFFAELLDSFSHIHFSTSLNESWLWGFALACKLKFMRFNELYA